MMNTETKNKNKYIKLNKIKINITSKSKIADKIPNGDNNKIKSIKQNTKIKMK